jgi:hypothetical protein
LTGREPMPNYLGAAEQLVEAAVQRAGHYLKDTP